MGMRPPLFQRIDMGNPTESKPTTDTTARKVCPEVQRFIERVVVPALVKQYIRELQEGKLPARAGSVEEAIAPTSQCKVERSQS